MPGAQARIVTGPAGTSTTKRPSASAVAVSGAAKAPRRPPGRRRPAGHRDRDPAAQDVGMGRAGAQGDGQRRRAAQATNRCNRSEWGSRRRDGVQTYEHEPSSALSAPNPLLEEREKDVGPWRRSPDSRISAPRPRLPAVGAAWRRSAVTGWPAASQWTCAPRLQWRNRVGFAPNFPGQPRDRVDLEAVYRRLRRHTEFA